MGVPIGVAWPAASADFEAPSAIRAAVDSAARADIAVPQGARLEVAVGAIDSRIHLPFCHRLDVSVPEAPAPALTARVQCAAPAWTLYVPLTVHVWGDAVVAAANLGPGRALAATDLTLARVDLLADNGAYITDPRLAEGRILRGNVRAGMPIPMGLLDQPVVVRRGETVVLTLRDGGITIRTNVVAQQDGRAGDTILVENPDSRRNLRATVSGAGGVELRFDGTAVN